MRHPYHLLTNILMITGISISIPLSGMAQEKQQHAKDQAAIRRAVQSYVAAFNRGDAEAAAAHWSEAGQWISPSGQRFQGRDAIQAEMTAYFAEGSGQRIEILSPSIRFLAPTVAIEEGRARVTRPGELPEESSYIAIHTERDGVWKLDSVRETLIPTAPSNYEQLKELEWMIGTWIDQDENATVETTCQWTKNRNFMSRSFKVMVKDRIEMEGTQVIGWDPVNGQIRSWVFDSQGGFGEGIWSRKDNRWIVRFSQILQGGEKASSINIITYIDDNTFTWQSIGREIDGELLPNVDEFTVVRK